MKKDSKIKFVKPTCPKCGAKQTLYRVKGDELLCRVCGHTWKRKETK